MNKCIKICNSPFEELEIDDNGNVFFCCEHRTQNLSIGNIFKEDFFNIWNSQLAQDIREKVLSSEYTYCNKNICHKLVGGINESNKHLYSIFIDETENNKTTNLSNRFDPKKIMSEFPKQIQFPLDHECNAKCIFCRDEIIVESEESISNLKQKLQDIYLPICKNISVFTVNVQGDAFASRYSRELIKLVSQQYPHIQFKIMTNGIAATEKKFNELGLVNFNNNKSRIKELCISINASKQKTHEKIFRIKGFKQLKKNLDYVKKLKENNYIETLNFVFIVNSFNYKEMKSFIKFSQKYGAQANLWEVRDYCNNSLQTDYSSIAVHLESHSEHKKFKKLLSDKIFNNEEVVLSPVLDNLRNNAILDYKKSFKYKILKYITKKGL